MTSIPQIPAIGNAFANLFSVIEAMIGQARAKAEIDAPGSGRVLDDLLAKLLELKSKVDVPSLVAAALKELADAVRNGSIVVPSPTDLAR